MKKILGIFLITLTFFAFAMASSEIGVSFVINGHKNPPATYVASTGFWSSYGAYVFIVLIVLIMLYAILKTKVKKSKSKKKKVSRKKRKN